MLATKTTAQKHIDDTNRRQREEVSIVNQWSQKNKLQRDIISEKYCSNADAMVSEAVSSGCIMPVHNVLCYKVTVFNKKIQCF